MSPTDRQLLPHPAGYPNCGWFPDPSRPGQERWFDGYGWSDEVRRAVVPEPTPASDVVTAGYVLAVILPLFGIVLGFIAATRPNPRERLAGIRVIALSIVLGVLYVALYVNGTTGP